jgi:hypothetical protein
LGVNDWSPPGRRAFSVGVGDDEVLGAGGTSFSLAGLHAVREPMRTKAAPPAAIAMRRLKRSVLMMCPVFRVASGFRIADAVLAPS